MLRITQMPWSNSRSAYMRCEGASSAMLICAPQRSPTTAETKRAMHAAQKTRTAVMEFTRRIIILALLFFPMCAQPPLSQIHLLKKSSISPTEFATPYFGKLSKNTRP